MKSQLVYSLGVVAAATTFIGFSAPTHAASFTAQDAVEAKCVGKTECVVNDFFTLSADPGNNVIAKKKVGDVLGLGVRAPRGGDTSGGEIDFNEILNVGFKKATVLNALQLSFLYQPGVYNDKVFEMAMVGVTDTIKGILTVKGDNTAEFKRHDNTFATVLNASPSLEDNGGSYSILNPFGDLKISGFSLTAMKNTTPDGKKTPNGSQNSDFTLSGVDAQSVPEPATVGALLGLGALGLIKRRKGAAS